MTAEDDDGLGSPRRMRRVIFAGAALALGAILSLAIAEAALRIFGYDGEHARITSVFDPRYGTVRRNSWIYRMQLGPDEFVLREQRVPVAKADGETRVLFVGDSGTEGAFVTLDESYPLRFEALMREHRPEARVRAINAGVFGMTTLDELHFLPRMLPLEPDVVVLGLFLSNDINFNLGHVERRRPDAPGSWALMRNHSALAHFVHLRALASGASFGRGLASSDWLPQEVRLVDRYGFHMLNYPAGEVALYMREPSPLVDRAYHVLEQALLHFEQLGREHRFRFAVLLIPAPSAVAGSVRLLHFPLIFQHLRKLGVEVEPAQLDVDLPRRRVMALCEQSQILCVDPTDRLQEIGMEVFFPTNEHPTAIGHEALAAALAGHGAALLE